jgi:CBS domain-containing protein
VREAVLAMNDDQTGLVTVVSEQGAPVGVFSSGDVVRLVAEGVTDLSSPIAARMRPPPAQLAPNDFGHEAALAMVSTGRRHVLVVDQGRLTGVLTERDLFTLQRVGLAEVSRTIHHARDVDTLRNAANDVRQLAHAMMAQGIAAEPLTRITSTLNDGLCERIVGLETTAAGVDANRFCWLTFGSEGRLEQTLFSDQDNGLVFDLRRGEKADKVRDDLLPLAKRINEALATCGFPLCKGNVMAGNPECCLSVTEWQRRFSAWVREPTPQAILDATIYFDLRPLYGRLELARSLRAHLVKTVPEGRKFLHLLVQDALERRPPIGFFRDFVVDNAGDMPGTLDLKTAGITPFVDAARIYGLANGLLSTNTGRRLRDAADAVGLDREEANGWADAFHFVQVLRLRHQHALARASRPLHNRIDPYALNPLDRRFLLEALRQAAKLQKKVAGAYGLAGM